jgi:hypothetical protein
MELLKHKLQDDQKIKINDEKKSDLHHKQNQKTMYVNAYLITTLT